MINCPDSMTTLTGISVPNPAATSQDKLKSNFDSVKEQTGLFAGKGGYDVTVKNHTQLDGAVIASTADKEKNRLDTGTLGWTDIHNQADYSATHSGGSFSTGGPVGKDLLTNMAGGMLSGANNSGHAEGTTKAGVSEGALIIRDKDKQQQDVTQLNRDTEHANDGSISPIFNKEKEQNRLKQAQLIGEIGGQAMDVIRTQGDIAGLKAQKDPAALAQAREQLEREAKGKPVSDAAVMKQAYDNAMQQYGTGSDLQKAAQAVTGALTALAGNNLAGALASGASPYLATEIKKLTTNPLTGKVDIAANAMAHAVLGAVTAQLNNQSAVAGGLGAGGGELAARVIAGQLFPDKKLDQLSESEKQQVSALSQLAAGLAGALVTGDTAGAVTGAQAGKNAVENNYLSVSEKTELELAKQKLQNSKDPAEREQAQQKINVLREKDITSDKEVIDACSNGNAGSAACAGARLKAIEAKEGYEGLGNYNSKASQQYSDAYGQIVNLLNITSVDAQNQQQIQDAMINFFMTTKGVDYATAKDYTELKQGADIIIASVTPILGAAAAKQLGKIVDANVKVVVKGNVDGSKFTDTNQGVRPPLLADINKPTLIDGRIQAKIEKLGKDMPNGNMATAHAEVGVIQQAYEKGMTLGREMTMTVSKEPVCGFCRGDVAAMAEQSGLKSLTIYEEQTGKVLYWQPGMKSLKVRE